MKIRELLDSPEKWTQLSEARDERDLPVEYYSEKAVKWCLYGAYLKCYPDIWTSKKGEAIRERFISLTGESITSFNDAEGRTFEEIKQVVDKLDM